MAGERLTRILDKLASGGDAVPGTARVCEVCVDVADMSGAGIMLMSGEEPRGSVCTTDEVSALIEELQYTLGEGPCVDAYHQDRPVFEPDLADPATSRWVAFTPAAVAAGVRAIFGFPLQVGAVRLGALNLYRDRPGPLTDGQHADALVLAGVAAQAVLAMQAQAPPGMLAAELEDGANFRFVVHEAAGMMSVQLGVSVADALLRLRAYAFAEDRLITEVAEAVVARRLCFDDAGSFERQGSQGIPGGDPSPGNE
jgi:GAF domain-containing protein